MRIFLFLPLFATPLSAQIFADVSTTLGDFSIDLYYEDSPKAVANLMTLAEGTRPWIDSTTGEIKIDTPYYDGIIFHRVVDGFMNQAGSPNGTGSDGPGYNFPDEVDNGLLHDDPYLLSAANSGPHTNGSQFFTTVVPTPWLDGIHTVYGKIVTGTDTIDAINNTPVSGSSPVTPVTINSMTIRRVGPEAESFDEFGQGLPVVTVADLKVVPSTVNQTLGLDLTQPPGSTLQVSRSTDLQSWTTEDRYLSPGGNALSEFQLGGLAEKEFYRASLIQWGNDAQFPDSLLEETINMTSNIGTIELNLTDPGTIVINQGGDDIVGQIDYSTSSFSYDGYGASLLIQSVGIFPIRFRFGADLPMGSPLTGRVTGTVFNPSQTSISGTFSVEP